MEEAPSHKTSIRSNIASGIIFKLVTPLSYAFAANRRPLSKTSVLLAPKALRFAAEPAVLLVPTLLAVTKLDWFALIFAKASSVVVYPLF